MAKLQNNFLKLYEEMNQLWEADDNTANASNSVSPANNITKFTFDGIAAKAIADTEAGAKIDTDYWCEVRELLLGKRTRMGDPQASSWYKRFLTFYKAYKVECAAKKWLETATNWGTSCTFGDGDKHGDLTPDAVALDAGAAQPDLLVRWGNSTIGIECKSLSTTSSIHKAALVIRHTAIKSLDNSETKVQACLVGIPEGTKSLTVPAVQLFGGALKDLEGKELYLIDPQLRSLATGFKSLPVNGFELTVDDIKSGVDKALETIDGHLNSHQKAIQNRAELILKQQTQELDNITSKFKKDLPDTNLPNGDAESNSLADAAQNLVDAAQNIEDVVTSI